MKRGTGLVNNELYIGRLVWNRLRYVKDPSTGKRVSRLNPESAWITTEVPELRIVDDALWEAVRARQGEIAGKYANVTEAVREHHKANRLSGARRAKGAAAATRSSSSSDRRGRRGRRGDPRATRGATPSRANSARTRAAAAS